MRPAPLAHLGRGVDVRLSFLPRREVPLARPELPDAAQVVFDVARKAQLVLRCCADGLEKVRA